MEIMKYGLGIVIGMILATIYFTVFDNKGLGIEFVTDTKVKKEYITVFKDTCAVVRHMAIGRDYREANTHIEASSGVISRLIANRL